MDKLVNVHYLDKEAFLSSNGDNDEEVLVFGKKLKIILFLITKSVLAHYLEKLQK